MKRLASIALVAAACGGHSPAAQCPAVDPTPVVVEPGPTELGEPPPPPPAIDRDAIAELAATRSFNLGLPRPVALLPDGDVLFLRTGPRDYVAELFEFDLATGQARKLASAADLVSSADVALSAAEKAKRERMRMTMRGIVSVSANRAGDRLLVPLGAQVFVVDRATGKATAVATGDGYPDSPLLSPDGRRLAFLRDGDVWITDVAGGKPRKLTRKDGPDVSFGAAEFAAAEELDRTAGTWWSPAGDRLLIQRTDEAKVATLYVADPAHPERPPTPFRYPRAGADNADVRLAIYPAKGGKPLEVAWDRAAFPYVHDVQWPEHGPPTLVVLDRAQTELRVLTIDDRTGATKVVVTESDPTWVNAVGGPRWAADGKSFLWLHEGEDAWTLVRHAADGAPLATVIGDDADFHGRYAVDDATGEIWFTRGTPVEGHVWSVRADGSELTQRTDAPGSQRVVIADRGGTRLLVHDGADGARSITVVRADGTAAGELPSVAEPGPALPQVEVAPVTGATSGYWTAVVRPRDFDPGKKYPVVLQVYAGPTVTTVTSNPRAYWKDQLLADTGFIVVRGDGRGTPGRGRAWERVISGDLITVPMNDQIEILQALGAAHPEMDLARVGVVGWSFGGYFSAMAAELRPDVFKAAIAGAPVTDWRYYDTAYTERYMRLPSTNAAAYDAASAVVNADKLSVPLLLIHGLTDDNVYAVNTLALAEALFKAGKPFDFVALSGTHMVADPAAEAALLTRQIDFFRAHLGLPTPAAAAPQP
ncbi:MAG: S9 family peptidase [Myxococcales bacterium]|nr:S9 family peptidase [Myxococcales bacterium]